METRAPRGNAQKKTPPAEADGGTNYEKMNTVVRDSMIGYVFKEKKPPAQDQRWGWGVDVAPPASLGVIAHVSHTYRDRSVLAEAIG